LSKRISASTFEFSTLVDLLRWRALQQPEQRIYTFLTDGETEQGSFTFAELDRQARIIAASLQEHVASGERALLIYPSGLEFIAAFFGCLYSGIIAIPVYPPSAVRSDRTLTKFRAIAQDAQPQAVLTATSLLSRVEGLLAQSPELQGARTLVTDTLPGEVAEQWQAPAVSRDTLAFFQYTSGSTGLPKGVMVTHGNLLHNSSLVERYCEHPAEAHGVTWLPLYHDLGLIGGILQPLYAGYESTIMTPAAFLQRPVRWLQAISRTRATINGAPNFAYDLLARKVTEEQKASLDLSHWEIMANGAEPVRADTLERFTQAFASCGFRRANAYPCYGLAEATLVVSAGKKGVFPTIGSFQARALEHNQAINAAPDEQEKRTLVSIGHSHADQKVIIVDTDTFTQCAPDRVGEIWIAGPSVAQGYWHKPAETEQTFHAYLSDTGEGPFLRSGDLGFYHNEELFITGRLKDLIIIRGSNYYPQDIEVTVERSHPALRLGGGAAFSVDMGGEERLVVVNEVERQYLSKNLDEVVSAMRQAIAEQHELQVAAVVLIKTGSLPKTSSGKVQRRGTREAYLEGTLDIVKEWKLDLAENQPDPTSVEDTTEVAALAQVSQAAVNRTVAALQAWLVSHVSEALRVKTSEIDIHTPFAQYGMDSVHAVNLSAELEDWLGRELPPTLAYDYPTIETLAHHLAGEMAALETPAPQSGGQETERGAIAVIGIGCRFPGADSPEDFWHLLRNGFDGISEVPAKRWNAQRYYDPQQATPGKMNTRWGGFLDHIDQFDPAFFGISPREAAGMDPQQRLLLEVAWETLEHAGLAAERIAGSQAGVFIGISSDDYSRLEFQNPRNIDAYAGTGNAHSIAANRLSYFLDLRGPSIAIDTACSSSLVAVHQACQSLRSGECNMALAGGVNLILTPDLTIALSQARMMSSDGHCKTFDESADGYVRGEGCGLVLLKPLADAVRDKDNVLAVIRSSAVNQDGRSNGLTAPNGPSQEAVIRQALRSAGVTPGEIGYVETHGSSTPLGDPIEVASLKAVLMQDRAPDQPCLLGSVKTNIGHLEAAAGIAGLIKTILSLQYGEIAPHLHLKKLNPHISLANTTFAIPTTRQPWPQGQRRLAGVSAFGFGGTNAHVILEAVAAPDQPAPAPRTADRPLHVLALSAQSEQTLSALVSRYEEYLTSHPTSALADLCATANSGRTHFAHRLAIIAATNEQLRARLADFTAGLPAQDSYQQQAVRTGRGKIAFLFTGQGSQYVGMARELYDTQPTFRQALDRCDGILRAYLKQPLLSVLYPQPRVSSPLDETAYTQPALFALEYALAEMWRSWGIKPDVVMGHSVGEYVAACVAGMFSLEDGLKLIATRARLMQELPRRGAMAVVFAEPARITQALTPFQQQVTIAVLNGPGNTVLSGDSTALQTVVKQLEAQGLTTHPVTVSHAFHSPLMDPMLDAFEEVARQVHFSPLRVPLVCNLTGQMVPEGEVLDAGYWRRQVREAVQFSTGIQTLADNGYATFLELGPNATLCNLGKQCLAGENNTWLPSLRKGQDDWQNLLRCVTTLYVNGRELDWSGFERDYVRQRLILPTYPFAREYCWFEHAEAATDSRTEALPLTSDDTRQHPLLDAHVALAQPAGLHVWEVALDKRRLPYLSDHRIQGAMALPVSVYVEMAQEAVVEAFGQKTVLKRSR